MDSTPTLGYANVTHMSAIRTIALIFFFGPLAAMFGEPFFQELFDLLGWDSEDWAAPVMNWIANNTAAMMFMVGLGAGVWVHYFATKIRSPLRAPPTLANANKVGRTLSAEQVRQIMTVFECKASEPLAFEVITPLNFSEPAEFGEAICDALNAAGFKATLSLPHAFTDGPETGRGMHIYHSGSDEFKKKASHIKSAFGAVGVHFEIRDSKYPDHFQLYVGRNS